MKKVIVTLIFLLLYLQVFSQFGKNYDKERKIQVNLNYKTAEISKGTVWIGATTFVTILTLNRLATEKRYRDSHYFYLVGITVTSATIYSVFNGTGNKYKPRR